MLKKFLAGLGLGLAVSGCQSAKDGTLKEFTVITDLPAITCTAGEPAYFHFAAVDPLPSLEGLDVPARAQGPLRAVAPRKTRNFRLGICFDQNAQNPTLMQIADTGLLGSSGAMSVPESSKISGLEQAIFGESYQGFSVDVPLETLKSPAGGTAETKLHLLIKGYESTGGRFIAAYYVRVGEGEEDTKVTVSDVLIGGFEYGDLPTSACQSGEPLIKKFTLGSAAFSFSVCPMIGTSGTHQAKVVNISITDSAAELPEKIRGVSQVLTGEALEQAFTSNTGHHNVCDSFAISLPHAVYAATADKKGFGGGACEPPVALAPERPENDQGGVMYRIRYGDEESLWISGTTEPECAHYLWRCQ